MKEFLIKPTIRIMDCMDEFIKYYNINKDDIVMVSNSIYAKYLEGKTNGAYIINHRKYGMGEPTDIMAEGIYNDIKDYKYNRVIAIGGGTILDVAKLFALKNISPIVDLYDKKLDIIKEKKLILVPTTCGTGSEVTNISILELSKKNTKMGLAVEELYADEAVIIPELLEDLPYKFFATSSIDAFIHSVESFLSPKANDITRTFSEKAIKSILKCYKSIELKGEVGRLPYLREMLLASTYAGIAFGNAGCGAVHAMSYPLGAAYHIPHGEANYAIFTGVFKTYQKKNPNGSIKNLNSILAKNLECNVDEVYDEIEKLLDCILVKKTLKEYGVKQQELIEFTSTVIKKQTRLMANNYVELNSEDVLKIYEKLY